jgi:hypothetical protein
MKKNLKVRLRQVCLPFKFKQGMAFTEPLERIVENNHYQNFYNHTMCFKAGLHFQSLCDSSRNFAWVNLKDL